MFLKSCQFKLFADDLKLYHDIACVNDCSTLQEDLNRLLDWCIVNKLKLNWSLNVQKLHFVARKINSTLIIQLYYIT